MEVLAALVVGQGSGQLVLRDRDQLVEVERPDAHHAVGGGGCQPLPVRAEVQARDEELVAAERQPLRAALGRVSKTRTVASSPLVASSSPSGLNTTFMTATDPARNDRSIPHDDVSRICTVPSYVPIASRSPDPSNASDDALTSSSSRTTLPEPPIPDRHVVRIRLLAVEDRGSDRPTVRRDGDGDELVRIRFGAHERVAPVVVGVEHAHASVDHAQSEVASVAAPIDR